MIRKLTLCFVLLGSWGQVLQSSISSRASNLLTVE